MFYDETIKFRAERGLAAAMAAAARKDRTRSSEWARRALRKAVEDSGVTLPPIEMPELARSNG
jgi:hypothetical protein